MKKYRVTYTVVVEADNREAARDKMLEKMEDAETTDIEAVRVG